jgi:hypothetical protein
MGDCTNLMTGYIVILAIVVFEFENGYTEAGINFIMA